MKELVKDNFGSIITVCVTILGFIITYYSTKKSLKNEIAKEKITQNIENIQELPYEVCQLMNTMLNSDVDLEKYKELMSKIIAYGSKDAISIAIHMQKLAYISNKRKQTKEEQWELLASYSLLITQIKYDLSSEIISLESWFQLKITNYEENMHQMKSIINKIITELSLNKGFLVKT